MQIKNKTHVDTLIDKLISWQQTNLGSYILNAENKIIKNIIDHTKYATGLQVSFNTINNLITANSKSTTKNFFVLTKFANLNNQVSAIIDPLDMSLSADSVDLCVIQHILDIYLNPKLIIKEVAKIILPSGKLVVTGFNPISLVSLNKFIDKNYRSVFSNFNFTDIKNLCSWMEECNFKVDEIYYNGFLFSSFLYKTRIGQKIEELLTTKKLATGFCYTVVARKQKYAIENYISSFNKFNSNLYPNDIPKPSLGKLIKNSDDYN